MYFLILRIPFFMNWMFVAFANFSVELFAFSLLCIRHSLYILMLTNCELKAFSKPGTYFSYFNGIFSYIETKNLLLFRIHFLVSYLRNNSISMSYKYIILWFLLVKGLILFLYFMHLFYLELFFCCIK